VGRLRVIGGVCTSPGVAVFIQRSESLKGTAMKKFSVLAVLIGFSFSVAAAVHADEPAYDFEKVVYSFRHKEKAKGTGGTKKWEDVIKRDGSSIFDYTVHIFSKRGPGSSFRIEERDGVITFAE
jgi:hypothetical protein